MTMQAIAVPNQPFRIDFGDIEQCAVKIVDELRRLGVRGETDDGRVRGIAYRKIVVLPDDLGDRFALLAVNTDDLPGAATPDVLEAPKTVRALAMRIRRRIWPLNTARLAPPQRTALGDIADESGLIYVLELRPEADPQFPASVALPPEIPSGYHYALPIGVDRKGQAVWTELASNVLIGGTSRGGKSTLLRALLTTLVTQHGPDTLNLVLIDLKRSGLTPFASLPHLARPLVANENDAAGVIEWLTEEMLRRQDRFDGAGVDNLREYNHRFPQKPVPLIFVVIDEIAELVELWKRKKEPRPLSDLIRLASKGLGLGIALCIATQYPKVDYVPGAIHMNCQIRMSFRVFDFRQSESVLGCSGAEKLPAPDRAPGRMLTTVRGHLEQLQGFLVEREDIERATAPWNSGPPPSPITALQAEFVRFACEQNGGDFGTVAIFGAFKERLRKPEFLDLAQAWERKGWLHRPRSANLPRRVTRELAQLAGIIEPAILVELPARVAYTEGEEEA